MAFLGELKRQHQHQRQHRSFRWEATATIAQPSPSHLHGSPSPVKTAALVLHNGFELVAADPYSSGPSEGPIVEDGDDSLNRDLEDWFESEAGAMDDSELGDHGTVGSPLWNTYDGTDERPMLALEDGYLAIGDDELELGLALMMNAGEVEDSMYEPPEHAM